MTWRLLAWRVGGSGRQIEVRSVKAHRREQVGVNDAVHVAVGHRLHASGDGDIVEARLDGARNIGDSLQSR